VNKQAAAVERRLRRLPRSERGGALVELAVALPLLILIAIGVMDYGRVFFTSIAVSNAARAGAEWGAYGNGTRSDKFTEMGDFAKLEGAEAGTITVTANRTCRCGLTVVTCATATNCGGGYGPAAEYIEVTATKTVALILKYPGLPTAINISRTATFRSK
jgi:Flp pilus assembly protein TadG